MKLLILSSHGVLEYDDLRLFTRLGYDVFMPGGYADPRQSNDVRPGVPEAPYHPELAGLVQEQRERHAGQSADYPVIDWGKADLHPRLIEWADIIMVNCFPESWIGMQWNRIREKRVIWRTIGQSDPSKEYLMRRYVGEGLQVVRYSPAEKRGFEQMGAFAGEDAMIRFAKDASDYGPWDGSNPKVGNLAQHGTVPGERDAFLNWSFVTEATEGLPREFVGKNSEHVGGKSLEWDELRDWLRHIRCMVYTGTIPASYTLGLMEALLTGVPVIAPTGPMARNPLWEDLSPFRAIDAPAARGWIDATLSRPIDVAWDTGASPLDESRHIRNMAIDTFGYDAVGPLWLDFLGSPVKAREMVAA